MTKFQLASILFGQIDMNTPVLYRYSDAKEIRNATANEVAASAEAAEHDGGAGVITVDGVACYVLA